MTYKGQVFDEDDMVDVYSGEDLISNLAIKAYDEDGEEIPADAFDLEITDAKGNVVTELVNAGTYTRYRQGEGRVDVPPRLRRPGRQVHRRTRHHHRRLREDRREVDDNSVARFAGTMTFGDKKDIT